MRSEYAVLAIGGLSGVLMAILAIWIYPRFASRLNDSLPRGGIARKLAVFPLKDVQYGSPENLAQVRATGYVCLILAAYCLGSLVWDVAKPFSTGMLPTYWPMLAIGIVVTVFGLGLSARANDVAVSVARSVHQAPSLIGSLFLVRKRPRDESETVRYLTLNYRLVGLGLTAFGILLFVIVCFGKPPPP